MNRRLPGARVGSASVRHRSPADRRNLRNGLLFISPWIVGFSAFGIYPIAMSLIYSFQRYDGLGFKPTLWVGWRNYYNILFNDPTMIIALKNTFYYALIAVPLGTVLAILVALLMNQPFRGQSLFRTIIYLPYMVPVVASALLFTWLLLPNSGLVNAILAELHLPQPGWMASPDWSKPALILLAQWGLGQAALIYLSGIQSVPRDLHESAQIDGAGPVRRFWSVTLPMISPVILYNVVIAIINSLQFFTQAFVMSGSATGNPAQSTLFYNMYLYEQAFSYNAFGYASALAWLLLLLTAALTGLFLYGSRRWVYYGSS
jgi:multiple sugar transport system permease protein